MFNIVLEIEISKLKTKEAISKNDHQAAFADINRNSKNQKKKIVAKIDEEAKKFALEINTNKTRYMIMGAIEENNEKGLRVSQINQEESKLEKVAKYVYYKLDVVHAN